MICDGQKEKGVGIKNRGVDGEKEKARLDLCFLLSHPTKWLAFPHFLKIHKKKSLALITKDLPASLNPYISTKTSSAFML